MILGSGYMTRASSKLLFGKLMTSVLNGRRLVKVQFTMVGSTRRQVSGDHPFFKHRNPTIPSLTKQAKRSV